MQKVVCLLLCFCLGHFVIAKEAESDAEPLSHFSVGVGYSPQKYSHYQVADGLGVPQASDGFLASGEWFCIHFAAGKIGLGLQSGVTIQKNIALNAGGDLANLFTIPIKPFLTYRLQFLERQILVPFVRAGLEGTLVDETATTNVGRHSGWRVYRGYNYAAGVQLNISDLEPEAENDMRADFGINEVYFVADYEGSHILSGNDPDLSYSTYYFGLGFEF